VCHHTESTVCICTAAPDAAAAGKKTELGHWKLGHTPINFTMGQFILLANFLLFAAVRNTPGLYESFGFTQDRPALVAFLLFQFLMAPMDEVCEADTVAVRMAGRCMQPQGRGRGAHCLVLVQHGAACRDNSTCVCHCQAGVLCTLPLILHECLQPVC